MTVVWSRADSSRVDVAGADRVWVLGVARSLDLFVGQGRYLLAAAPKSPRSEESRRLSREVFVQALGAVAASGALALIGAAVAALLR